ncbi:FMN-dependent NADH-azoreductase [Gordonia hydrophobica]|uniref:FMN dependent NADH:quinone oxidoreductase n=1 Tax=Gordonia hydrophobica TaxID=40516 RepID=A0ABZ2TY88_9ACTN|nr:NAD(P)H-dependent oxidoreductase [Gordonia hydrophobica]MBM7367007.1 FMN-dependent NADH-azoreductase [Gordonia hydrophobica]
MTYLLAVDSSISGPDSVSRPLVAEFADIWRAAGPDRDVVHRDLAAAPVPHLTTAGLHYPEAMRRPHENVDPAAAALQNELIEEVAQAAAVVIGAPMYNWSLPSTLKAWLDHLHVLGITTSSDDAPGRLHGIPVVVVSPRGLAYDNDDPDRAGDYTVPTIEKILAGSMGMDVTSVPVDFTLADRLPAVAEHAAAAADSLAAASERLREYALRL